ncbi:sensor histidine kinase [Sunxiuqinia sp. sy24]|uniref:sensor histidine kinase n=1 Tax=Sunxiuqinia sp. sy24 TaxID=3461495 RepID=UPI00404614F2
MPFVRNYQRYKILLQILFWLSSTAFALASFYVASDYHFNPATDILRALILNTGFALGVYINLWVLIPKLLKKKYYIFYTFWLLISMALASLIILGLFYVLLHFYRPRLFSTYFFTTGFYIGVSSLAKFLNDWIKMQDIELRYNKVEREKLKAELNTLKAQINPHFLFNSLNNIYSLSLTNSKKTPEMILKLSDLMRHVLYESRENFISLQKEIEFIHNFIDLQRIRLSDKTDIRFELDGDIQNKLIIPLIFEPFVDNAFKHGNKSISDNVFIHIQIEIKDNWLHFKVANNYEESHQPTNDKAHGIGLKNAQKRLEYLYKKEEYHLNISKKENIFSVELQLLLKTTK